MIKTLVSLLAVLSLSSSSFSQAPNRGINFQIYIIDQSTGLPLSSPIPVTVKAQILSPPGNGTQCVLREETFNSVKITDGYGLVVLGQGTLTSNDPRNSFKSIFQNSQGLIQGNNGCNYNPGANDARVTQVSFVSPTDGTLITSSFPLRSEAFAVNADEAASLQGLSASEFIKVDQSKNLTQNSVSQYFNALTTLTAGQTLIYNNGNWVPSSTGNGGGGVVAGSGVVVTPTNGLSSVAVDSGITANKIVQLNSSAQLPAVDGSLLTNLDSNVNLQQTITSLIDTAKQTLNNSIATVSDALTALKARVDLIQTTVSQNPTPGVSPGNLVLLGENSNNTYGTLPLVDGSQLVGVNTSWSNVSGKPDLILNKGGTPSIQSGTESDKSGLQPVNGAIFLATDSHKIYQYRSSDSTWVMMGGTDSILASQISGSIPSSQITGLGTAARLDSGTSANNLVQLVDKNGIASLPALDASQLSGITVSQVSGTIPFDRVTGQIPSNRIDGLSSVIGSAVGTLGTAASKNVGTSSGNVIQLADKNGAAALPIVDGSQLTGITAPQVSGLGAIATKDSVDLSTDTSSVLPVEKGGTGAALSLTATNSGGLVYTGANNLSVMTASQNVGSALISGGSGAPTWSDVNLSSGSVQLPPNGTIYNTGGPLLIQASTDMTVSSGIGKITKIGNANPGSATEISAGATGGITLSPNGSSLKVSGFNAGVLRSNAQGVLSSSPLSAADITTALGFSPANSFGSISGISANLPLSVDSITTPSIPKISIQTAGANANGALTSSDWNKFNAKLDSTVTFSGDISGTFSAMSVDAIRGKLLEINSLVPGNFLQYNGSKWVNTSLSSQDIPAVNLQTTGSGGVSGTLPVNRGGTGATSIGSGNIVIGNGTGALASLAPGIAGNVVYGSGINSWASGSPDVAGLVDKTSVQSISGAKTFGTIGFRDDSGANSVSVKAPAAISSSYTLKLPATLPASNMILQSDAAGNLSWVVAATGNGNALTSSPLSQFSSTTSAQLGGVLSDETGNGSVVFSNSPTLNSLVRISSGVQNTSGLQFTNFNSSSPTSEGQPVGVDVSGHLVAISNILAGDVSGPIGSTTVNKIKGISVGATPTAAGQTLRFDGNSWTPGFVAMTDLRSTVTGTNQFTSSCSSNQTLTYNSVGDTMSCTNISLPATQVTGLGSLASKGTVDLASSDVTGYLPVSKIAASGATSSNFLRGDGTWASPVVSGTAKNMAYYASTDGTLTGESKFRYDDTIHSMALGDSSVSNIGTYSLAIGSSAVTPTSFATKTYNANPSSISSAIALGYSNDGTGSVYGGGNASIVAGRVDSSGTVKTESGGTLAVGRSSGGTINASQSGTFAGGRSDSGLIQAGDYSNSGSGSIAMGSTETSSTIRAGYGSTAGRASFAMGRAQQSSLIAAGDQGAGSFAMGSSVGSTTAASTIKARTSGSFAMGNVISSTDNSSKIIAGELSSNGNSGGSGAFAIGYAGPSSGSSTAASGTGAIYAELAGSFAGGVSYSQPSYSSSMIDSAWSGSMAYGSASRGSKIVAGDPLNSFNGSGAFALGNSYTSGEITASGSGAFAVGQATNSSNIRSTNQGTIAVGRSDTSSTISSNQTGSFAGGNAWNSGTITTTSSGGLSYGNAINSGSISSGNGSGAVALGSSDGAGSLITSAGMGSLAVGNTSMNGVIFATGNGSFALGSIYAANPTAGNTITASGDGSFALGRVASTAGVSAQIKATQIGSFAFGLAQDGGLIKAGPPATNDYYGYGSFAGGRAFSADESVITYASGAISYGVGITNNSYASAAFGTFPNITGTSPGGATSTDHALVVGNGNSVGSKSNAFEVYKSGRVGLGGAVKEAIKAVSSDYTLDIQKDRTILLTNYNVTITFPKGENGIKFSLVPVWQSSAQQFVTVQGSDTDLVFTTTGAPATASMSISSRATFQYLDGVWYSVGN